MVLHGMLPQAGQTVVGSGLRAFANGEGLRGRGHEVVYCTRTEDLPDDLKPAARARRGSKNLLRQPLGDEVLAPGDDARIGRELTATEPGRQTPVEDEEDTLSFRGQLGTGNGLAPRGGPLGAPGNPWSFTEPHELQDVVRRVAPDVILVEALEEARALPRGGPPVILDLFAPRILEQQFQTGSDEREAVRVLDAIQRGDHFLFSNERQKYFHLPLLALAGVDCTDDAGAVVPISCPPELPTPSTPDEVTFVAGGVFWPWADIGRGLRGLVDLLDDAGAGSVHLYGGEYGIRSDTERYADPRSALPADHPRVEFKGLVPIDDLWADYAACSIAFDLMAPNPEREINLSFRQIDYLRCGLPVITSPRQVIAADVREYGAGWLVDPEDADGLRTLVTRLLANPAEVAEASAAAQRLARDKYSWAHTVEALDALVRAPVRRQRRDTFVGQLTRTQGDLWGEVEDNKKLRTMLERRDDDLSKKSEEVRRQDARIMQLMGTVDRLTLSLSDVSGFKNEAITYLGVSEDAALREAAELGREVERKELDLLKKDDALKKSAKEVAKLKKAVAELKAGHTDLEAKFVDRDRKALELKTELESASDLRTQALSRAEGLRTDLAKKESELHTLHEQRREELEDLQAKLEAALASEAAAKAERDGAEGTIAELRSRIGSGEADRAKKDGELEQLRAQLVSQQDQASAALAAKDAELARVLERLERQRARGAQELQRLQAAGLNQLERAESTARTVAEDLRDTVGQLAEQRSQLQIKLNEATQRLRDTERSLRGTEQMLVEERRGGETARDRLESEGERVRAELQEQLSAARQAAEAAKAKAGQHRDEAVRLRNRVDDLGADVDKKTRALAEAGRERDRAESRALTLLEQAEDGARDLIETVRARASRLQAERGQQRATLEQRNHELAELRRRVSELEPLSSQARRLGSKLEDLEADVAKKEGALAEAERDRQRLSDGFLATLARAEDKARGLLEQARDRIARLEGERGTTRAALEQARHELADAKAKLKTAEPALEELDRLRVQVADGKADVNKKDSALREARRERERLEEAFRGSLDRAEDGARALLEEAKDRVADLESERGELRSALERATHELTEARRRLALAEPKLIDADHLRGRVDALESDVAKKEAALLAAAKERRRLEQTFITRLEQAEAEAQDLLEAQGNRVSELAGERGRLTGALERSRHQLVEAKRRLEQVAPDLQELDRLRGRVTDLEGAVATKTKALAEAGAERERLSTEFLTNLEAAEDQAGRLLTELAERLSEADAERGRLRARVERINHELGEAKRQLRSREAEATELKDQLTEAREREAKLRLDGGAAQADLARATHRLEELETELSARKKELAATERSARAETARLEAASREAATRATEAREALEARLAALATSRAKFEATAERQAGRLRDLESDVAKKTAALGAEATERTRLEARFLADLESARTQATALLEQARDRLGELTAERGRLLASLEQSRHLAREAERNLAAREEELREREREAQAADAKREATKARTERAASERLSEVRASLAEARAARDALTGELEQANARLVDLEADAAAKTEALDGARREQTRLGDQFLAQLESAEARATEMLETARTRIESLGAHRAQLLADVDQLKYRVSGLEQDLVGKTAALESAQAAQSADAERLEATTAELSELRIRADRDNARVVELEAAERKERLERERQRDLLNKQAGTLEEAEFQASTLAEDQARNEAELVAAVEQRDAALAELAEVLPVLTERAEGAEARLNEAEGQLAEAQFNVESLNADVAKKNAEIEAAQVELDGVRRSVVELEQRLAQPAGLASRLRGR